MITGKHRACEDFQDAFVICNNGNLIVAGFFKVFSNTTFVHLLCVS